ncbi:MAG TPA: FHA domain-containing protein [Mobilitalea sp.]|nr:FHA domain-containing protein [Mobilitalea sp.]
MPAVECGRGHLYDNNIYTTCPYCNNSTQAINFGGVAVDRDNKTRPISDVYNQPNNFVNPMADPYQSEVSVLNEGKTLPPKDYAKPKKVEDDNKTVGLMKEKLGIDPVVGWLVCIEGKEVGKDYKIRGQINTIGRSEKMDICIKNDNTISNENHARLSYSERNNKFNLIPAESKNVIYLNDNEIFTPTVLNAYDVIDFGETKLMFIPFCSEKFDWKSTKQVM